MKRLFFSLTISIALLAFAPHASAITCGAAGFTDIGNNTCRGYLTTTGAGTWTVPNDWNSASNTIEVIGGGAGLAMGGFSMGGGGGGAYSRINNLSLTSGASVSYSVGTGGTYPIGNGGDSWFNGASCAGSSVCAKGGMYDSTDNGGVGGQASSGVGTVKYSGGNGGYGHNDGGGGGGGAAGPHGAGLNGDFTGSNSGGDGGAGDNGFGGAGGLAASPDPGSTGTQWDATHGSGGGGGGYDYDVGDGPGNGGLYGGGGGGGGGASGGQGIVVITYTASATAPTVTTNSASAPTPTAATLFGSITNNGGADATQHGFAYGTASNLSTVIATTTNGSFSGAGSFSSAVGSLSNNTTYYFRAYATNSAGTGYGSIQSFTTGNSTPNRKLRLFEGFRIKFLSGKIKLF